MTTPLQTAEFTPAMNSGETVLTSNMYKELPLQHKMNVPHKASKQREHNHRCGTEVIHFLKM